MNQNFLPQQELETAKRMIESIRFPSIPEAITALQSELLKSEPDVDAITKIIASDIKLSGNLLKLVNSAALGTKQKINSIPQATVLLGLKGLKNLLLASALRGAFGEESEFHSHFWDQANLTAACSEFLAHHVVGVSPEDAFLAGLFQDAGVLICEKKKRRYNELYCYAHSIIASILDFDRKIFKTTHMAISYLLAQSWELPEQTCDAILLSHNIDYSGYEDQEMTDLIALVSILKVSNYIVGKAIYPEIKIKGEGEIAYKMALNELMLDKEILAETEQIARHAVVV